MSEFNKANRQCCDIDIREYKTKAPFLFFDTANTTTAGITGDSAYARVKGKNAIDFPNPLEGTMTIEAQVLPFKLYSLLSDGIIESTGLVPVRKTVTASSAGTISVEPKSTETIKQGTVFVYAEGDWGGQAIAGTLSTNTFTATESSKIVSGSKYEVGYLAEKTGVKRISFNDKKIPKNYFITQSTLDKDEEGNLIPMKMIAYKAAIERSFDLTFSSEGDPQTVTLTFNLLQDTDGNQFDMVEDLDETIEAED